VRLLTQKDREPLGLVHRASTAVTRGHTDDNLRNLAPSYRARVVEPLRGTRIGRQELAAELLEDVEGALWRRSQLDAARVLEEPRGEYRRLVVGLDPADGTEAGAEQALVLAGLNRDGHIYVIRSDGMRTRPFQYLSVAVDWARERAARSSWRKTTAAPTSSRCSSR
jgi:phage terminase large subunit-like protein